MSDRVTDDDLAWLISEADMGTQKVIDILTAAELATELQQHRAMLAGITPARLAAMVRLAEAMGTLNLNGVKDDHVALYVKHANVTAGMIRAANGGE